MKVYKISIEWSEGDLNNKVSYKYFNNHSGSTALAMQRAIDVFHIHYPLVCCCMVYQNGFEE